MKCLVHRHRQAATRRAAVLPAKVVRHRRLRVPKMFNKRNEWVRWDQRRKK